MGADLATLDADLARITADADLATSDIGSCTREEEKNETEGGARNSCQERTKAEFHRGGGASYHARGWEEYNCHQREIHPDNNQRSKGNNEVSELDQRERRREWRDVRKKWINTLCSARTKLRNIDKEQRKTGGGTSSAPPLSKVESLAKDSIAGTTVCGIPGGIDTAAVSRDIRYALRSTLNLISWTRLRRLIT